MEESTLALFKELAVSYTKLPISSLILMQEMIWEEITIRNEGLNGDDFKGVKSTEEKAPHKPKLTLVRND